MSRTRAVPKATVFRLSLYLRRLELCRDQGHLTVSSRSLGETLNVTSAQVRKDLAYFGQFGHRGIGYRTSEVIPELRRILATDQTWNCAVIGVGNLGRALSAYKGFQKQGFHIVALFDNDPAKLGTSVSDLVIQPLDHLPDAVPGLNIRIVILCVPASAAQAAAHTAVQAGIRGILNFAPVILDLPPSVVQSGVDLAIRLELLSFELSSPHP